MKKIIIVFLLFNQSLIGQENKVWPAKKVNDWYAKQGWLAGANFLPSSAINQLEMWQADSFDPVTIDRELGWAENIGFSTLRVYLHNLVWENDPKGFIQRINAFLTLTQKHHIKPIFVFFDDCWNEEPVAGKQPEPIPGVHNSGWMRSPQKSLHDDSSRWVTLEKYVKDILANFKNDQRILLWDLYNEPANSGYGLTSFPLLKKIVTWAREINPSQPLTVGVWFNKFPEINKYQLENSDVISFHNYGDTLSLKKTVDSLLKRGRPVICTEYMARTNNSLFKSHLPLLKRYGVMAINWGLVSGKSNTIFPWDSKEGSPEPELWFHDIFRKDGTAFDNAEIQIIKTLTWKKE